MGRSLSYSRLMFRNLVWPVLACVAVLATTTPVFADQIDGTWCSLSGKSMTINGSEVTTPAGNTLTGQYTRHAFAYEIPEGEPEAGGRVWANQLNDHNISVTVTKTAERKDGVTENWTRCETVS